MKYTYSITDNKVYCITTYAGRTVRGIAKCDPDDTFNGEDGMKLSRARCDYKVARKRVKVKNERLNNAILKFERAKRELESATKYFEEACRIQHAAKKAVEDIESALS